MGFSTQLTRSIDETIRDKFREGRQISFREHEIGEGLDYHENNRTVFAIMSEFSELSWTNFTGSGKQMREGQRLTSMVIKLFLEQFPAMIEELRD
jgi:hypothetical protein